MRKENKEIKEKSIKKEYKINMRFINFIEELKNSKMSIEEKNKEKIEDLYKDLVNLRFSNLERVFKRVLRKELKEIVENILKEKDLSLEEFKNMGVKILEFNKERSNYIKVIN